MKRENYHHLEMTKIFVESNRGGYPISIFTDSEFKFLLSKELIYVKNDRFYPKFVGDIITTENSYFSLPKNFKPTQENIDLFKKVLLRYKDLKGKDGKTLLTNNSFSVSTDGKIESEKFYYNELKELYLDFITYEFIYPKKRVSKHSSAPVSGGRVDVFNTIRNRNRRGPGITYKTKDIRNSEEWNLDDIYYSTINQLCDIYASGDDEKQISDMNDFLETEGYDIKKVDLSDNNKIISDIKKCDVSVIHLPIKNILLNFYESRKIGEKFSINVFYTSGFQYVWEELVGECLKHNKDFMDELSVDFNMPTRSVYKGETKVYRDLYPDIFSEYNGFRFVGDAKYYSDPTNSHFDKEMYVYNETINNEYPMAVFIPSTVTRRLDLRRQGNFELIVFLISVEDAIFDAINNGNRVIRKVQTLIRKNTNRLEEEGR